jgi:uncharacterized C2H2 Zn-finger protein
MKEIIISILIAKAILHILRATWAFFCPRIYKHLKLYYNLVNDAHGNLYIYKSGKLFGRTVLPAPLNPFK